MAKELKNKFQINNDQHFNTVADSLLNRTVLVANEKQFRLLEVEFYLYSPSFQDTYTHCDPVQLEYGKLYFHRINAKGFKGGTFKCMDITFGDKASNKYCGVLVRAMLDLETNEPIVGPCKCVERLLEEYGCKNINELSDKFSESDSALPNILKESFPMDLVKGKNIYLKTHNFTKEELLVGPRIGLSDKNIAFQKKLYRYVIMKQHVKKEKTKLVKFAEDVKNANN